MVCARCGKTPNGRLYYAKDQCGRVIDVCLPCLYPHELESLKNKAVDEIIAFKYRQFFALENRIAKLEESISSDTKWIPQLHFHKERYPVVERLNANKGRLEVLLEWKEDINKNLNKLKVE